MTLEGAINLNETNDYIIYTMNSIATGQYGVVVPKNINGTLNMLVDLHFKTSFDGVGNGTKTREELVNEIALEYSKVKSKYSFGMLVMPMLDEAMFLNTVNTGDKQKMFDEVKKIGAITSELYKKLTDSGIDKSKIDQKIIMIEKKEEDIKFVNWLKEQMPNFVDGVFYSELDNNPIGTEAGTNNIFANEAPVSTVAAAPEVVTSTAPVVETVASPVVESVAPVAPVMNDIFASSVNEAPVAQVVSAPEVATPAAPVVETVTASATESVAPVAPVMNDIFASNTNEVPAAPVVSTPEVVAPAAPVVETVTAPATESVAPVAPVMNDIFAPNTNAAPVAPVVSTPEPVAPTAPVVENVATVNNPVDNSLFGAPVAPTPAAVNVSNNVDGPKPVESTSLDSTMTFTNIAEQVNDTNEGVSEDGVDDSNKSKGFVNLAILLVVIGVITFISIEIGKYLYNTFGA